MSALWHKCGRTVAPQTPLFNPAATPLLLLLISGPTAASDDPRLAGAQTCAGCHTTQSDAWAAGRHAAALGRLPSVRQGDAKCIGCHTTGLRPALQGVQCESCHGPADSHATTSGGRAIGRRGRPFMRVPDAVCYRCHTADAPRQLEMPADRARVHPTGAADAAAPAAPAP